MKRPQSPRKILLVLSIPLILAVFAAVPFDDSASAQSPTEKKIPAVRVEPVGTLDSTQPESILGVVAAKESVVLVPRVSGYLTRVAFQEGSTVRKGDLLFEIEDTVYKMNVLVAESVVRQIEAEIELAKKDLERTLALRSGHVATEQELDQAQRTISFHEARLDEAKAALGLAENDLSYTKIHAPLTGRISGKNYSAGNYLTLSSGALATIVQYDPITVKFPLSEAKYIRYFLDHDDGEKTTAMEIMRADGRPYRGRFQIDYLDNEVDGKTGTIMIYLLCENDGDQLLPGGWSRIRIFEKFNSPRPATPVAAVLTDGERHYVYVVGTENKVERRDVELGRQVYDKYVIASGLRPGEQVIVGGLNKISVGMEVRPILPNRPSVETAKK